MINELGTAAMGMLKAQKRAADLASDILKTASGTQARTKHGSNDDESIATSPSPVDPAIAAKGIQSPLTSQTSSLIQQISEFKLAKLQFRASATVFEQITESSEVSLGLLLDKKG